MYVCNLLIIGENPFLFMINYNCIKSVQLKTQRRLIISFFLLDRDRKSLQYSHRNGGTGFGIGQRIVVLGEVVATTGCHRLQLMVGQFPAKYTAGGTASAMELIIGIVHAIHTEYRLEATLVKHTVMRHQRQPLDERSHLGPHLRKDVSPFRILFRQSMNHRTTVIVIFRFGMNEEILFIDHLSASHYHHAHTANAAALVVGRLKIYSCKIIHNVKIQQLIETLNNKSNNAAAEE